MKTINIIIVTICYLMIVSCDKEIDITNPKIFTTPGLPHLYDTLIHEMIVSVQIDGEDVKPDSYEWQIVDYNSNPIEIIKQIDNKMLWMPLNEGVYTVSCKVRSGNKSITDIERFTIEFYSPSLYKHLIGKWQAIGEVGSDTKWRSIFNFKANLTYTSFLDTVIKGDIMSSLGKVGDDSFNDGYMKYFYVTNKIENNNFSGSIDYFQLLIPEYPDRLNGKIENIKFSSDMKSFTMDAKFTDYTVDSKDRPIYLVNYTLNKIE